MNEHLKFLVCFALACAVLVSPVACTIHTDRIIAREIAAGVDPMDAYCAHSAARAGCSEHAMARMLRGRQQ